MNEPVLPTSWGEVLDDIVRSLDGAIAAAAEREQVPGESSLDGSPAERAGRWQEKLAELGERLAALDALAGKAGEAAREADAVLAGGVEALRGWLATAQGLAKPGASAV